MMGNSAFTEMMLTDLIPMIEKTYRALPGAANRAMAGLSMGGMQTHNTTMANLDKFAYIGLFSGGTFSLDDIKQTPGFHDKVKLAFVSFGSRELEPGRMMGPPGGPRQDPKANAEALKAAGINSVFYVSPGTAHEFLSWRRALREFAPLLFKQ